MAQIDFPNLDLSSQGTLYPEGAYRVRIEKHEECTAKTGTPQVRWYGVITEGDHKGGSIIDYTALTESAAWRIGSFLWHAGINVKKLPKLNTNSESFKKVLKTADGLEMYWYVVQSTYNGNISNKVQEYKKIDESDEGIEVDLEEIPDFLKD